MDAYEARRTPQFRKNRKVILNTQDHCHLCGGWVDLSLPAKQPASPEVDHIVPLANGGHPWELENLALSHRLCNARKGGGRTYTPEQHKTALEAHTEGLSASGIEWGDLDYE